MESANLNLDTITTIPQLPRLNCEEIKSVVPDLLALAKQILESGRDYDLIISDDASGRLVALFVKNILDILRRKKGKKNVDFLGINKKDGVSDDSLSNTQRDFINKKCSGKRCLIVTEYICHGSKIVVLFKILKSVADRLDVASLSMSNDSHQHNEMFMHLFKDKNHQFFIGRKGITRAQQASINFYKKSEINGVDSNTYGTSSKRHILSRPQILAIIANNEVPEISERTQEFKYEILYRFSKLDIQDLKELKESGRFNGKLFRFSLNRDVFEISEEISKKIATYILSQDLTYKARLARSDLKKLGEYVVSEFLSSSKNEDKKI